MDFLTKPIKRELIRELASAFRKVFGYDNYYFDVIEVLERLPVMFDDVIVVIAPMSDPDVAKVPGTSYIDNGQFVIKIREDVYEGAYYYDIGGYRMHIMHEICHALLFMLGYSPKFDRAFKNESLNPYESIEWQAKALAGEILIPYGKTKGLSVDEIMDLCKVSRDAAIFRINLDSNEKK